MLRTAATSTKLVLLLAAAVLLSALPFAVSATGGNYWLRVLNFALLYSLLALGLNLVVGFAGLLDLGYIAFYGVGAYTVALLTSPHLAEHAAAALAALPPAVPGPWLIAAVGGFALALLRFALIRRRGWTARERAAKWLVAASLALAVMLVPYGLRAVFACAAPAAAGDLTPAGLHWPVLALVPLAALLAAGCGILLGAPVLKLRGDYLAIVTLGFGEIIRILLNNLDRPVNLTNGPQGINGIDPVILFGFSWAQTHRLGDLTLTPNVQYYYLFLGLLVMVAVVCARLQHSRLGRAWIALREDEVAAKAMGIHTRNVKLLAFALGASFGGISGAMFGAYQGFVSPESFVLNESVAILAMVVLGGIGHIPGVIAGALLLQGFPELLRATLEPLQLALFGHVIVEAEVMRQLLFGVAMVAVMRYRPSGLWPAPQREDRPVVVAEAP